MSDNAQDSEHTGQDGVGDRAGADLSASVGRLVVRDSCRSEFRRSGGDGNNLPQARHPHQYRPGGYRLVLPRFARRILCRGFPTGYVALCRPSGCPDQEPRPVRGRARFQPGRIVGRPFLPARNSRRGDEHQAGGR